MQKLSMIIKYDGSRYFGWQRQSHLISVQEVLEKTLSKTLQQEITIDGSGRTDAGVHAMGQCISFSAELNIPVEKLKFVLNSRLPSDICIESVNIENDSFHARYDAIGKTYIYKVYTGHERDPFVDKYSYHYPHLLNIESIREAMEYFVGTHDFKTFMAAGSMTQNTIRTIHAFILEEQTDFIVFTITGDGFLYNMVRIIMGSLLHVGAGKISASDIPNIINSGSRDLAKFTVPANGLYLKSVYYRQKELDESLAKND